MSTLASRPVDIAVSGLDGTVREEGHLFFALLHRRV